MYLAIQELHHRTVCTTFSLSTKTVGLPFFFFFLSEFYGTALLNLTSQQFEHWQDSGILGLKYFFKCLNDYLLCKFLTLEAIRQPPPLLPVQLQQQLCEIHSLWIAYGVRWPQPGQKSAEKISLNSSDFLNLWAPKTWLETICKFKCTLLLLDTYDDLFMEESKTDPASSMKQESPFSCFLQAGSDRAIASCLCSCRPHCEKAKQQHNFHAAPFSFGWNCNRVSVVFLFGCLI